jgi:ubiquitin carboxyl-terminal hydrolase 25/28
MDTSRLYTRGKRTIDDNPERYHDSRPQLPAEVLGVLRTYLSHALQKRPDEKRRIAVRNRRFLLAFSDECNDLLEYLGFSYLEEPTVVNGVSKICPDR